MKTTTIRAITAADRDRWLFLWAGYLHFYRHKLAAEITVATWGRLLRTDGPIHGLVAERGGTVIGFAHYLFHASTWSADGDCYLEDLYVDEAERGSGAARALITEFYARADAGGARRVYWQTQAFNAPARALYDTLAHLSSSVVYER